MPVRVQDIPHPEALALAHPDRWGGNYLGIAGDTLPPYKAGEMDAPFDYGNLSRLSLKATFRSDKSGEGPVFDASRFPPRSILGIRHELIIAEEGDFWIPDEYTGIVPATATELALGNCIARGTPRILDIQMHSVGITVPDQQGAPAVQRTGLIETGDGLWPADVIMPGRITVGEVTGGSRYMARITQIDVFRRK